MRKNDYKIYYTSYYQPTMLIIGTGHSGEDLREISGAIKRLEGRKKLAVLPIMISEDISSLNNFRMLTSSGKVYKGTSGINKMLMQIGKSMEQMSRSTSCASDMLINAAKDWDDYK